MSSRSCPVAFAACLSLAAPASAEQVKAGLTAYFYAAPGYAARVLDEVEPETVLDLHSCERSWCRVKYGKVTGYVREAILVGRPGAITGRVPRPAQAAGTNACFEARRSGAVAWQENRFCLIAK